jgi:hypothetical protein
MPPSTRDRLDEHDVRIAKVETALGIQPPPPGKSFLRKKYEWVISHKLTTFVWSLVLVFGAYYLNHKDDNFNKAVDDRITAHLEKTGGVNDSLKGIQTSLTELDTTIKTLQPFIQDLIRHQFENASKLPPSALQERLPSVQHLLLAAQSQQVRIDPTILTSVSERLAGIHSGTLEFWQVAAMMINYKSFNASSEATISLRSAKLPDCTEHDPTPMTLLGQSPDRRTLTLNPARYENCRLVLDSLQVQDKINSLLLTLAPVIRFEHCLVVYRGAPVKLIVGFKNYNVAISTENVVLATGPVSENNTLFFQDCLFDFEFAHTPPDKGQEITERLLADNNAILTLPIARPTQQ